MELISSKKLTKKLMTLTLLTMLMLALPFTYALPSHDHNATTITWEYDGVKDGNSPHQHHDSHAFYFSNNGSLGTAKNSPNGLYWVNFYGVWDNEARMRLKEPPTSKYPHGFIDIFSDLTNMPDYYFKGDWSSDYAQQAKPKIIEAFSAWSSITADPDHFRTGIAFYNTLVEADAEIIINWSIPPSEGLGTHYVSGGLTYIEFNINPTLNATHSGWFFGSAESTPLTKYHFFSTALHETGHAVGLNEQVDLDDVMVMGRLTGPGPATWDDKNKNGIIDEDELSGSGPAFEFIDSDSEDAVKDLYSIPKPPPPPPPPQPHLKPDIDIVWYATSDAAYTALVADEIDMIQWALTEEQRFAVEANPNIQIASCSENGMFEFDLNNDATIMDYPTALSPTSVKEVRQAIAYLVDKDYIIANILLFAGSRIDAPVAYPQTVGWVEPTVVSYDWNGNWVIDPGEDNYPYKYNIDAAVDLLAGLGFSDTDANGYLNYPNTPMWGTAQGADTTTMPLKICIRADHTHRREAGRLLYRQLEGDPAVAGDSILALSPRWAANGKVGGDFDTTDETWVQVRAVLSPVVMGDRNYHIYTGGWSLGRYPTYLFNLYHSMFWYPYGPNYVTNGAHPILDTHLEGIYYAVNLAAAQASAKLTTGYHVRNCVNIPLWSYTSYVAWRKELAGIINMKGYGIVNDYTFLNAYRANNPTAPVRFGVVSSWDRLNILYSQWYFEYTLLDRVYTGLINANPYDLAVDIPWVAQDWEVSTWTDPRDGYEKTAVTYWIRHDVGGAEPITGNQITNFNAYDYEFTVWYNYAFDDSWQWSNFMDIHDIEIIDTYQVKVYFDDYSYWFTYAPTYPLLGPSNILVDQLCEERYTTFTGADLDWVAPDYYEYQFTPDQVVQVIYATVNDTIPIYEGVDFYIRAGYDTWCHNTFVALRPFNPGDVITIYYYRAKADGAVGTYLGGALGYDWTNNMFAYGTHYPISISSTAAALNANPYFFLKTTFLGEIDWRWYYTGTTKPRTGNFKIDILDVVKCTGSYSSRGDGIFNPTYVPGADLDASDLCHVGILDLVTICCKYSQTFGKPP
jgi:hypothetical protein